MHKILVAGSRKYNNLDNLKKEFFNFLNYLKINNLDEIEVLSGCAKGPDSLILQVCEEHNIKTRKYPANWEKLGKSAGYERNKEMIKDATHALFFWDNISRGTQHAISLAKRKNIPYKIVKVYPESEKIDKDKLVCYDELLNYLKQNGYEVVKRSKDFDYYRGYLSPINWDKERLSIFGVDLQKYELEKKIMLKEIQELDN